MHLGISSWITQVVLDRLTLNNNLRWLQTGWKLLLLVLTVQFASTKTIKAQALDVDIGNITELKGNTRVVRDKPYESVIDFSLNSMDRLETAAGRMGVTFQDDTTIRLTENSNVIIDDFVYNPNQVEKSAMALNFIKGTGRFISSKTKKRMPKDNIKIRTHAAVVGIRGTDFTITVSEKEHPELKLTVTAYSPDSVTFKVGDTSSINIALFKNQEKVAEVSRILESSVTVSPSQASISSPRLTAS